MMKWVQNKGKVEVDPRSLLLECLLRIYNDDKSMLKEQANRYLAYIHIVSQIDDAAPYFKSDYTEVRSLAKKQLFGDYNFEFPENLNNFLDFCVQEYQTAYEHLDARASRVFRKKIDELIKEVDSKPVEVVRSSNRGMVTFVSNFPIISKMMVDSIKLLDVAEELEARVKKQSEKGVKVRANRRQSILTKRLQQSQLNEPESTNGGDEAPEEEVQ